MGSEEKKGFQNRWWAGGRDLKTIPKEFGNAHPASPDRFMFPNHTVLKSTLISCLRIQLLD